MDSVVEARRLTPLTAVTEDQVSSAGSICDEALLSSLPTRMLNDVWLNAERA